MSAFDPSPSATFRDDQWLRDIGGRKRLQELVRVTAALRWRKEGKVNKLIISNLPDDADDEWGARKALKEWNKQLRRGHWLKIKPAQW
jgi:hypothetical protein